ncbi:Berberine/berberine domain protein [Kribbella flavida DSM 17836]|uniref:Berberine/berberine domain protein n=1 Tax=Kribbella flavida (strain DSM 17836 / JCM 10339 / NBRC 14399) TaxID=479435 RepID=D2PVB9_KRIFD|nr:FAD-binding protein [Kribbella flavida]ADB33400.1 Berberine/berberine domain protein [Kribbella flavida DSM 17836]
MPNLSRRHLLAATAGAAVALPGATSLTAAAAPPTTATAGRRPAGTKVLPDDARYQDLVQRGINRRFVAEPDYARVVHSTQDAVDAVQEAVRANKRIAVRGGGHCFEDFVDHSDVEVLIDLSQYDEVSFDERLRAFSIGAGATLETVYKALFYGWGVTVPGGGCLGVGVGGHFSGGGYGPLSRRYGSVVDHLYGVEVVVVGADRRARAVVATRDNQYRDLWWAHTGGGGGNFGVVTRYLMRTAGARGSDPAKLLPKAPSSLLSSITVYDWKTVTKAGFLRTLRNFFDFYERNNAPDSPYATLYSPLILTHVSSGSFLLSTQIDAGVPDAAKLLAAFNAAMVEGVTPAPQVIEAGEGPFLRTTIQRSIAETTDPGREKYKAGYLRKGYTDAQLETIYRHLSDPSYTGATAATLLLVPYGGQVNTVPSGATATAQRDVIAKMVTAVGWTDPAEDAKHIGWLRTVYRDIYRDTGGVPVPNEINAGSYINYPDRDLADPEQNTSGVPWHTLYYLGNYPRLQRIKKRWDPGNVFRHRLSIEPAE